MQKQETVLTFNAREYEQRIEEIRKASFESGYKAGEKNAMHLFKFGVFDDAPKSINHMCDICSSEFFGTDEAARNRGWELMLGSEFCPMHSGI